MEDDPGQNKSHKHPSFESLSKEDLVLKCKYLLGILKKAKATKDEAVAELEKFKAEHAKVILGLEEQRNKAESDAEALQEMVSHLTENKMALVTKNESLQRQLTLQLKEVEALKHEEKLLLQDREEINTSLSNQQKEISHLKEVEKTRVCQMESLKNECKKLCEEKRRIQQELNEATKGIVSQEENKQLEINYQELKAEKIVLEQKYQDYQELKAEKIVLEQKYQDYQELKAEKIILEQKYQALEKECERLNNQITETGALKKELVALKESFTGKEAELNISNKSLNEAVDKIKELQMKLTSENQCHILQFEESTKKLETALKDQNDMNAEIERLNIEHSDYKRQLEKLQEKIHELENALSEKETSEKSEVCKESEISELKEFYVKIVEIIGCDDKPPTKDEAVNVFCNLKSELNKTHNRYNAVVSIATKMIGLASQLFNLKQVADFEIEENFDTINSHCKIFERNIEIIKSSNLEELCNKCFSKFKQFCCDVDRIEELMHIATSKNPVSDKVNELRTNNFVSKPMKEVLNTFKKLCVICSDFFGFGLSTDLLENIEMAQAKMDKLSEFILVFFSDRYEYEVNQEQKYKQQHKFSEKQQVLIQSLESDLKAAKEKLNEIKIQVLSKEVEISELIQAKERLNNILQKKEECVSEHSETITKLEIQIRDLEDQVDSLSKITEEKNSYKEEIASLKDKLERTLKEKESFELKIKVLMEEYDTINIKLAESLNTNEVIVSSCSKMEEEIAMCLKENKDLKETLSLHEKDLDSSLQALNSENENLKFKLDILLNEKKTLQDNVLNLSNELQNDKEHLEKASVDQEEKLKTLESVMAEKESVELMLKNCLAMKDSADLEVNRSIFELNALKEEKESMLESLSSLKEELSSAFQTKDSALKEIKELENRLQSLEKTNEQLEKHNNDLKEAECVQCIKTKETLFEAERIKTELEEMKATIDQLSHRLSESSEKYAALLAEKEKIRVELEEKDIILKLKIEHESKEEELSNVLKEKESLKELTNGQEGKINQLEEHMESINGSLKAAEAKLGSSVQENEALKQKLHQLEDALKDLQTLRYNLAEQLQQSQLKLNVAQNENRSLVSDIKSLTIKVQRDKSPRESKCSEAEENMILGDIHKRTAEEADCERSEIITELIEMNKIILKRGEKISLLEDALTKKNKEMEALTTKLKEIEGKLSVEEEELASKQKQLEKMQHGPEVPEEVVVELKERINVLEQENFQLRKFAEGETASRGGLNPPGPPDTASEVMSSSTVSRVEEIHRMKELEDTFEERYMKLKGVAIKLKKKVAEQMMELKALEESKQKLVADKEKAVKAENVGIKNIQVLQGEIDRLQDTVDANRKDLKESEKNLLSSAQENAHLKSQMAASQDEAEALTNTIKNLEASTHTLEGRCQHLEGKVSELEQSILAEQEQRRRLEQERVELEKELETEKRAKEQVVQDLEEAKQENKKHSLIDLEMKDYERTVEELTLLSAEKDAAISDLQTVLEKEKGRVESFSLEVSFLQEQSRTEADRADTLKDSVSEYKAQLSDVRESLQQLTQEKEKYCATIEDLNQELERQKLSLAEVSSQASLEEAKLRKEKDVAQRKVDVLEDQLTKHQRTVEELRKESEHFQKEYQAYKVRAQSVLRQKTKVPVDDIEQIKREKEHLSADLEAAQLKLHQLQSELTAARAEIGFLCSEKERLSEQVSLISSEASRKENSLQTHVTALNRKLEDKTCEYQRIISNMSSQTEAMDKSFKSQLEAEREKHSHERLKLEKKLEELVEQNWVLKSASSPLQASSASKGSGKTERHESILGSLSAPHHSRLASHGGGAAEDHKMDFASMVREEGEGSEWVEPTRSPSQHLYQPPSLETLLSNPFPPHQHLPQDETMSIVSAATETSSKEIAKLEAKLGAFETRLQQLTSLLTESEAENAKLSQLTEVLKEEIRRVSRNESREKHLENNEYIKNIILKFLRLKTGDEKYRLVPVLKTLLQLSPEETTHLTIIARGDDAQTVPQGWGNYLHLWSGR